MAKRIVDEEMRFSIIVNGDRAQKELYDLEKSTRDLTQRNKELRQEKVRLFAQGKKESEEYKRITQEIKENNTVLKLNKARMSELQKQIGITGLTMNQLKKRASELRLQLNNMVPGTAEYKRFQNDLKAVNVQLGVLKNQSRTSTFGLSSLANGFNKYAALGASVIATVTGVVFSVQKLIDFNGKLSDAVSDVQKTTGMTKKEVEEMAESFGLLQTRTNRIDLLKIAEEGGRIGIAKEEIADFVAVMDKAVVALSDSFPGGAEETASKLGKLKLLFKETKEQSVDEAYNAIGSAINDLGAQGVATEINIANFATRVGSLPDALKPSISDALALGAAFEENGIQAEIAGRAYSILLTQAAEESGKFAEVMGITNKEVQDLINKNPLEFLIKFAKGLQGMNATDIANTLQYLGVSADGANKVLGALSNNTERFGELMEVSNRSMEEGTSLINEYNIKNNNFAATLDKLQKYFRGIFVSGPITKGIQSMITNFAKLVGAIEDTSEATEKERINLLVYESKLKDVNTSNEERLKLINELKRQYPGFLQNIETEKVTNQQLTVAIKAVNDQLINKIILQSQDALIEEQNQITAEKKIELFEREETVRRKLVELAEKNNIVLKEGSLIDQSNQVVSTLGIKGGRAIDPVAELSYQTAVLKRLQESVNFETDKGNVLLQKRNELYKKLNIGTDAPSGTGPLSGTFNQGGLDSEGTFTPITPKGDGGGAAARQKSLLDFTRATEDARLELLSDSYRKELEIQRVAHERKIQDLQSQKVTGIANATEINAEINKQIQIQEEINQLKIGIIIENGLTERFSKYGEGYEKEKAQRLLYHNQKLASLGDNEKAREKLQEDFNARELREEQKHLNEMLRQLDAVKNSGYFEGINLELLTPEQVQVFEQLADQLIAKLAEIGVSVANIKSGGVTEEEAALNASLGAVDILGFSQEQWAETFDTLDTMSEKIAATEMVVGSLMNVWGMYHDFVSKKSRTELQRFQSDQDKKAAALERNLENGYVNQRQYEEAKNAMELESQRFKAEMDYKQAKREKSMTIASIIQNTALGVIKAAAALPLTGGLPWSAIIAALGAVQLGFAIAQPLPAKGFEMGYYGNMPVQREQDGRVYNATYGGRPSTQMVDSPKYFLAGEGGKDFPEMIIDGKAFKQFNPEFKNSLYREIARVKGYESGYYQTQTKAPEFSESASTEERMMMIALLTENAELLRYLKDNGVEAYLKRSLQVAKDLREDIQDYENLRAKNRR